MEPRFCSCGCGGVIPNICNGNRKYINGHQPNSWVNRVTSKLTYKIFTQLEELILDYFKSKLIECSVKSPNINLKNPCLTTKPRRGEIRTHPDRYLHFAITIDKVQYVSRAHVVAAMIAHGDPGDLHSLHECDIKMCCNPNHMYFGTQKENILDYCNRRKEAHPNYNLTRLQINSILYHLEKGVHTVAEIAKVIGCHKDTIYNYSTGRYLLTTDGTEVLGKDWKPIQIK